MGRYARNSIGQYAPVGAAADDLPGGTTPTGKKTIDTTAEVDVASYATAQVVDANLTAENIKKDVVILGTTGSYEGGSSDFSTAEVTVVNNSSDIVDVYVPIFEEGGNDNPAYAGSGLPVVASTELTLNVIMYKGTALLYAGNSGNFTVSGDLETMESSVIVTGNGTVTYTDN